MPSRGRPELCKKCVEQAKKTASNDVEILVYVDNNDPEIEEYKKMDCIIGTPLHSGKAIKYLSTIATHNMMMFGTDDLVFHTAGWDKIMLDKMPKHGLSVLYPSTLVNKVAKSMIPFFTKRWVEVTGLFPDYFEHFGPDTWVVSVARHAEQFTHVKEVYIEHKKVHDVTYSRSRKAGDAARAKSYLTGHEQEMKRLANKVRAEIER